MVEKRFKHLKWRARHPPIIPFNSYVLLEKLEPKVETRVLHAAAAAASAAEPVPEQTTPPLVGPAAETVPKQATPTSPMAPTELAPKQAFLLAGAAEEEPLSSHKAVAVNHHSA